MKWTPEDVFRQPRAGLCAELKDVTQHTQDQRDSDLAGESDRAQKPRRGWGGVEEKHGAFSHMFT